MKKKAKGGKVFELPTSSSICPKLRLNTRLFMYPSSTRDLMICGLLAPGSNPRTPEYGELGESNA